MFGIVAITFLGVLLLSYLIVVVLCSRVSLDGTESYFLVQQQLHMFGFGLWVGVFHWPAETYLLVHQQSFPYNYTCIYVCVIHIMCIHWYGHIMESVYFLLWSQCNSLPGVLGGPPPPPRGGPGVYPPPQQTESHNSHNFSNVLFLVTLIYYF
jgi:hypothetical protein